MKVTIYGSGTFGFVLARHLGNKFADEARRLSSYGDDRNYQIFLYGRDKHLITDIQKNRVHPVHFPEIALPGNVTAISQCEAAISDVDVLILAVKSQAVRSAIRDIGEHISKDIIILHVAKGLELETNQRLSRVIEEELARIKFDYKIAVFSGGTIAKEMIMDAALGAEIACADYATAQKLQELMSNQHLRVYANTDTTGVEYAGALKNVISIGAGISDGLKNPSGSKTLVISRASAEAKHLALQLGAQEHTFSTASQAWSNDLWMSCIGDTRNRYFGELIGKGCSVDDALAILTKEDKIAEGYPTAKVVHRLAIEHNVEIPVMGKIYEILYEGKNPREAMHELMTRQLKFLG